MEEYKYTRSEQIQVTANAVSQQVFFSQDVYFVEVWNVGFLFEQEDPGIVAYVHEEGNIPANINTDTMVLWLPLTMNRLVRKEIGISVITGGGNVDLRITGRY